MTQPLWASTYRALGIATQLDLQGEVSLVSELERAMLKFSGRPAFHGPQGTLSYAELDRQSAALAAWLQVELGVRRGDRIAVMLPNILAFPVVMLGVLRAGCVQVNANPLYTAHELEHQLHDADCKAIFVYSGSSTTLAQVRRNPALVRVIGVGAGLPGAGQPCWPAMDAGLGEHTELEQALGFGQMLECTPVPLSADDLLFLQYTGGTTGLSKGAMLSHGNLLANLAQYRAMMPSVLRPGEEVLVTAIPLYHIFALMVSLVYMTAGAALGRPRPVSETSAATSRTSSLASRRVGRRAASGGSSTPPASSTSGKSRATLAACSSVQSSAGSTQTAAASGSSSPPTNGRTEPMTLRGRRPPPATSASTARTNTRNASRRKADGIPLAGTPAPTVGTRRRIHTTGTM